MSYKLRNRFYCGLNLEYLLFLVYPIIKCIRINKKYIQCVSNELHTRGPKKVPNGGILEKEKKVSVRPELNQ